MCQFVLQPEVVARSLLIRNLLLSLVLLLMQFPSELLTLIMQIGYPVAIPENMSAKLHSVPLHWRKHCQKFAMEF